MITCLISDLDGTLVDNERANALSYVQAFADVGVAITEQGYLRHFGLRFPELAAQLAPTLGADELAIVRAQKAKYYRGNVDLIKPNTNLVSFLRGMSSHCTVALATTASKRNALFVLEHFDLASLFAVTVFGEDVKAGKPDPECYNICIERCGVEPRQCIIFEDSKVGIEAAEATGAGVIKIFSEKD